MRLLATLIAIGISAVSLFGQTGQRTLPIPTEAKGRPPSDSAQQNWQVGLEGRPLVEVFVSSPDEVGEHPQGLPGKLSNKRFRDVVELVLRQSQIKTFMAWTPQIAAEGIPFVEPPKACLDKDGNCGRLLVSIGFMSATQDLYVYNISVQFREWADPRRGEATWTQFAVVWSDSTLGIAGGSRFDSVTSALEETMKRFALDYLKANPAQ